jgi:hypothetical protein
VVAAAKWKVFGGVKLRSAGIMGDTVRGVFRARCIMGDTGGRGRCNLPEVFAAACHNMKLNITLSSGSLRSLLRRLQVCSP